MAKTAQTGGVDQAWVPLDEIAPVMARAAVAAEDAEFCNHWGLDVQAARLAAILPDPKNRDPANPTDDLRARARSILDGAATIAADGRAVRRRRSPGGSGRCGRRQQAGGDADAHGGETVISDNEPRGTLVEVVLPITGSARETSWHRS